MYLRHLRVLRQRGMLATLRSRAPRRALELDFRLARMRTQRNIRRQRRNWAAVNLKFSLRRGLY